MKRKLIIDGNAVYEIDEDCMLRRKMDEREIQEDRKKEWEDGQKKALKNK